MNRMQATEQVQQESQHGQRLVVDILRTVNARYGLVAEIKRIRKEVATARKDGGYVEMAKPFREALASSAEKWNALTADSDATDFKSIALEMASARGSVKEVNEEFAETVTTQTEAVKEKSKAIRTYDTLIPQMLADGFIRSLL